jgi:hypothetical protein
LFQLTLDGERDEVVELFQLEMIITRTYLVVDVLLAVWGIQEVSIIR